MQQKQYSIKILFVCRDMGGGGAERLTIDLVRNLNKDRFKPTLFIMEKRGRLLDDIPSDIEAIFATEKIRSKYDYLICLLKLILYARRYQIIVGTLELTPTYYAWLAGLLWRKPVLGWVHIAVDKFLKHRKQFHTLLFKTIYPRLNGIICVSKAVCRSARELCPKIKSDRIQVIYNFIDIENIRDKSLERIHDNPSYSEKIPVIVACGRLHYQKGFDVLIRAHANIIRNGMKLKLIILGEGGARRQLVALAKDIGVSGSILMPGFADNPYSIIRRSNVFVLSSRYEGFGLVVCEAMALGVPVIATECEGPVEILKDGKYGILIPPDNEQKLTEAIESLLKSSKLREELSKIGKERVKLFSARNIVPLWDRMFEDVVLNKYV